MKKFHEVYKDSGLGKWFKEKWVDISRKDSSGKHPLCGDSADKEGRSKNQKKAYPKCRPAAEAGKMSSELKKKATEQKRRAEKKSSHNKGRKPVVVSHKDLKENFLFLEKNVPLNKSLWSKAQAWARNKFDVHPSAYSNAAAAKYYKQRGGKWKSVKESSFYNFGQWLNERVKNSYDYNDVLKFAKKLNLEEMVNKFDKNELIKGINTEKEHMENKDLDVIKTKPENVLKIALAHLQEDKKYYSKLSKAGL